MKLRVSTNHSATGSGYRPGLHAAFEVIMCFDGEDGDQDSMCGSELDVFTPSKHGNGRKHNI